MSDLDHSRVCTGFIGARRVGEGPLADVVLAIKAALAPGAHEAALIFDDATGETVEVDWRGAPSAGLDRLPRDLGAPVQAGSPVEAPAPRGRGRPKLGVVAREVTLLPRHWEWLAAQPGGASVALRKLVEAARGANRGPDQIRRAQEAAGRVMLALAGDLAGYEDATRALYARHKGRFDELVQPWPADVRDHVSKLAAPVFA